MNGLEFVSSLVGSLLSWPVAAVAIAMVLRAPLGRLLDRVRRGKLWGGEFDLEESSKQADASADRAAKEVEQALAEGRDATADVAPEENSSRLIAGAGSRPEPQFVVDRFTQAVVLSGDGVLDEVWTELLAAVHSLYRREHPDDECKLLSATKKASILVNQGLLPEPFMDSWRELLRLNRARRGEGMEVLTIGDFDRYLSAARELTSIVRKVEQSRFGFQGRVQPQ